MADHFSARLSLRWLAGGLVVLGALARLMPGAPPNFAPVGAMGLFAGSVLPLPWALGLTMVAMVLSDAVIGFYGPISMGFVYLGMIAATLVGRGVLARRVTGWRFGGASLGTASAFFLLSNFGTWMEGLIYPQTWEGLVACYVAAIPFFGATLAAQLIYGGAMFGVWFVGGRRLQMVNPHG